MTGLRGGMPGRHLKCHPAEPGHGLVCDAVHPENWEHALCPVDGDSLIEELQRDEREGPASFDSFQKLPDLPVDGLAAPWLSVKLLLGHSKADGGEMDVQGRSNCFAQGSGVCSEEKHAGMEEQSRI